MTRSGFARLGIAASVQFSHAPSDRDLAERFWADETDRAYASARSRGGAVLANGSDAPIEELDPLLGIRAGVLADARRPARLASGAGPYGGAGARRDDDGAGLARTATSTGAESSCPGYLADLVVLDRDPLECAPEELAELRVEATMLGGRWVHGGPPF